MRKPSTPEEAIRQQLEIARAAGVFAAVGTIYRHRDGTRLQVKTTRKDVAERFALLFRINVYKNANATETRKDHWAAQTAAKAKVNKIVCALHPFLSSEERRYVERAFGDSLSEEWLAA